MLRLRTIERVAMALLLPVLSGCYLPLAYEAAERWSHEHYRSRPESKVVVRQHLETYTCQQLAEWEQGVAFRLRGVEASGPLATLSSAVLQDDLVQLRATMAARGCPPLDVVFVAAAPLPATPETIAFRCVCWQPYAYYPIAEAGAGPAGPGCVTVRAELSPGRFVFVERAPQFGERRHEVTGAGFVYGSLERETVERLIRQSARPPAWTNTETDGWLEVPFGRLQILADDCSPLTPDAARRAEQTVARWLRASAQ